MKPHVEHGSRKRHEMTDGVRPALPEWTSSCETPRDAMRQILQANPDETFVLVNSLPRTASKYVLGVLSASYGALHMPARPLPRREQLAEFHVAHCHGLSLSRSIQIMAHEPETLDRALVQRLKIVNQFALQRKIAFAKKIICISIVRESTSRALSNFVIQKRHKLLDADDVSLIAEYKKFQSRNEVTEKRWWADNVTEYFGFPEINPRSVDQWLSICTDRITYLIINIERLDAFFDEFLFHQLVRAEIAKRSVSMELVYGLDNLNTASGRASDGFDMRVKDLVASLC